MDGYISKSAFAKVYGCAQSYVTKLKDLNRLVLSEDGKQVNVEASLRLIEATGDPSKTGVRERWEAYRNGDSLDEPAAIAPVASAVSPAAPTPAAAAAKSKTSGEGTSSAYHQAKTQSEQFNAQLKHIELRKLLGQISEVAPMVRGVQDTHASAKSAILQLPDRLTQMIAPETDPVKVHELLRMECERVCEVMQREVQRLRESARTEGA